ncbi:MAG: hypothetical protein WCJ48_04190 [Actinomycetes bacterium]
MTSTEPRIHQHRVTSVLLVVALSDLMILGGFLVAGRRGLAIGLAVALGTHCLEFAYRSHSSMVRLEAGTGLAGNLLLAAVLLLLSFNVHTDAEILLPTPPRVVQPDEELFLNGEGGSNQEVRLAVVAGGLTLRTYPLGKNPDATTMAVIKAVKEPDRTHWASRINLLTVTDARSGSLGWTLTANVSPLDPKRVWPADARITIAPACEEATAAEGFDYDEKGAVLLKGYEAWMSAPGHLAGPAKRAVGTVVLCEKDQKQGLASQSTGGIYSVGGIVALDAPHSVTNPQLLLTLTLA